jgi:hypothetical protein
VHQRPEDVPGDYEYDLAHEQRGRGEAPEKRRTEHPGPAPVGREVEYDQDMSYDQAHDF